MENTTSCPYCGEEILSVAKKCKHCKEQLDLSNIEQIEDNSSSGSEISNVIARPIEALIGYLLFYFGDWHFITDFSAKALHKLGFSDSFIIQEWGRQVMKDDNPSLLSGKHSILIKIDESYHGFICGEQFFDSPVIQWVMLSAAVYLIIDAVWHFIFDFRGTL